MNLMKTCALIFLLSAGSVSAQEWVNMVLAGKSYPEIQTVINIKFDGCTTEKEKSNYCDGYKQYLRWEHFWKSRTNSNGKFHVPDFWESAVFKKKSANTSTSNWSFFGLDTLLIVADSTTFPAYPGLGRINAIAFDPDNNNIIWVVSPSGGVWRSSDAGQSGVPIGDNLPNMGISDIAIDPSNGDHIYLATEDDDALQNFSIGILESTDGGNTWNDTGFLFY